MNGSRLLRLRPAEAIAPLAGALAALVQRASGRRAGLILLVHHVDDVQGDPERELMPALARGLFERQVRHLCRHYRVVPLTELRAAVAARRRFDRHPVSLTLDDDDPRHATHALPVLRELGVRATFFLSGRGGHWWHDLQSLAEAGQEPDARTRAYEISRLPPKEQAAVAEQLRERAGGPPAPALSPEGREQLIAAGQDIGWHTREHHSLTALDDAELEQAITEGADALGVALSTFAYPHNEADQRVAAALRNHGFELAVTCERTAVEPHTDPMLLGRVWVHGASLGELVVQVVRGLQARG